MAHKPYTREDVEKMKADGLSETVWGRIAATVEELERLRERYIAPVVDDAAEARFERLLNQKRK